MVARCSAVLPARRHPRAGHRHGRGHRGKPPTPGDIPPRGHHPMAWQDSDAAPELAASLQVWGTLSPSASPSHRDRMLAPWGVPPLWGCPHSVPLLPSSFFSLTGAPWDSSSVRHSVRPLDAARWKLEEGKRWLRPRSIPPPRCPPWCPLWGGTYADCPTAFSLAGRAVLRAASAATRPTSPFSTASSSFWSCLFQLSTWSDGGEGKLRHGLGGVSQ